MDIATSTSDRTPTAGRRSLLALAAATVLALAPDVAGAAEPAARYVPCPVPTGDPARYAGPNAAFRCHFAIADPNGLVVILREGRAAAEGTGPFGRRHAAADRGVGDEVIARVLSTVQPVEGQQRRLHYVEDAGEAEIWVVVDRAPSTEAPDTRPFGVITAFCRDAGSGEPQRCQAGG